MSRRSEGGPVRYDALVRGVGGLRRERLLRELAKYTAGLYYETNGRVPEAAPLWPWDAALIAKEALLAQSNTGAGKRKGPPVRTPTFADLVRLGNTALNLSDPALFDPAADLDDFFIRVTHQQFGYTLPTYHPLARMRPMFDRPTWDPARFKLMNAATLDELVGGSLEVFIDSAPFFGAATWRNEGRFDPAWLVGSQFDALRERIDTDQLQQVFDVAWSGGFKELRAEVRAQRSTGDMRRYDWNPLIAYPFVRLTEGGFVAPNAWLVNQRIGPSAIYYLGMDKYGAQWGSEMGYALEDYAVLQLDQLSGFCDVIGEQTYVERGQAMKTVDVILVFDVVVVLIEVKGIRSRWAARTSQAEFRRLLAGDLTKALGKQIPRSNGLVINQHPVFAGRVPVDRPVRGLVVTAEPIPMINSSHVRRQLPQTSVQTAIVSMSELEDVVATCLHERSGKVFLDITTPDISGGYAPLAALGRGQRAQVEPRNAVLDSGFDDGAFPPALTGTD